MLSLRKVFLDEPKKLPALRSLFYSSKTIDAITHYLKISAHQSNIILLIMHNYSHLVRNLKQKVLELELSIFKLT